jgi:acyl dehydratase
MAITELSAAPSLAALYPKAVLTGLRRRGGRELPDTAYALRGVRVGADHLAAYDRVCGLRLDDELPATYPHVLTFPLQVKLMTAADFPFPLAGSVHVANRITQARPLRLDDELELRTRVANLRDHPRGKQFDMISEALVGGETVWTDVSTYLRRSGESDPAPEREHREPPEPTAIWRVPADIGRRYAEVSGDRNPIHLHTLAAKLFGYPRAIAHGMWTKARCLAAFEGRLPAAFTIDVRFKTPVLLPGKVGFAARSAGVSDGDGWRFELFGVRNGKPHVEGFVGPPR